MLISTQIQNFIEIGAFLIFFSYKLQRGEGVKEGDFFWAPDLKVLRKQDFIDGVKITLLSLNAIRKTLLYEMEPPLLALILLRWVFPLERYNTFHILCTMTIMFSTLRH